VNPEVEDRAYYTIPSGFSILWISRRALWGNSTCSRVSRAMTVPRLSRLGDVVKVQHFVHTGAFPHIASHIFFSGKEGPQVGDAFKARQLESAEFQKTGPSMGRFRVTISTIV